MASSVLTKSFTNKVKRSSASNNISFSNLGGFLMQTFNSISNNFVNARPTMESSFQNVYLLFSNIRRRIEDLRFHEKKIWFPQTNTIFCTAMGKAWDKSLIFLLHPWCNCKTIMSPLKLWHEKMICIPIFYLFHSWKKITNQLFSSKFQCRK